MFSIRHKRIVSVIVLIIFSQFILGFKLNDKPLAEHAGVDAHIINICDSIIQHSKYNALIADSLVNFSQRYLGVRYQRGGMSMQGLDCSGFTKLVYAHFGYTLDRTAHGQALQGDTIELMDIKRGDLVFFKGRNLKSDIIGHVGIAMNNDSGKVSFIHASVNNGISFDHTESSYYKPRYVCARRIIKATDSLNFRWIQVDTNIFISKKKDSTEQKIYNQEKQIVTPTDATYVVQKGDNLYALSRKFNCTVKDLMDWNQLTDNTIKPSQVLLIRNPNEIKPKQDSLALKPIAKEKKEVFYTVKEGDTLWSISKKYKGVSVSDISNWNKLGKDHKIKPNMILVIYLSE